MGLHKGLTEDYAVEGTKVRFRGKEIGDLTEKAIEDIVCSDHCNERFFDEVLGVPDDRQRLRVVKKHSIPERTEENDF